VAKVDKDEVIDRIHKRIGKIVSKMLINDAIIVICNDMVSRLADDDSISIHNFGTFSTDVVKGYVGRNINGEKIVVGDRRLVRFIPHNSFVKMIKRRTDNF
jgi:nucleoid DNA-binding protein